MKRAWRAPTWAIVGIGFSALLFTACGEAGEDGADGGTSLATGPEMSPGDNCRSCHGARTSPYPNAPDWSVAGTVFAGADTTEGAAGVVVRVRDAAGLSIELVTNRVGNFYTSRALTPPYVVELEQHGTVVAMPVPAPSGGCNACHSDPALGGAPGRLFVPDGGTYESWGTCLDDTTAVFPAGTVDQQYGCAPYRCTTVRDAAACTTSCQSDVDCAEGASCREGRCS